MYSSKINMKIGLQLHGFWSVVVEVTIKKNKNIQPRYAKSLTITWFWVPNWKVMGLRTTKKVGVQDPG